MKTLAVALAAVALLTAVPSFAQSAAKAGDRSWFIEMDTEKVDGKIARPSTLLLDRHSRPKWERLFSLKKSMRPALHGTAADSALK